MAVPTTPTGQTGPVRTLPVGPDAVLVEVDDAVAALDLAAWARASRVEAADIVPGAASVLFDGLADPDALVGRLASWVPSGDLPQGAEVEIEVVYDGPDLEAVAERWGVDVDEVVARHTSIAFVSAFCGFAPGFAYLSGLPADLAVPRLESPRSRVPAGSVGLAGSWCGIYPTASPGGWQVLGHTDAALWDAERAEPALLAPGTRVRFRAVP